MPENLCRRKFSIPSLVTVEERGGIDFPVAANAFGARGKIRHFRFGNFGRRRDDPSEHMSAFGQFDFLPAGEPGFDSGEIVAQIADGCRLHVIHRIASQ